MNYQTALKSPRARWKTAVRVTLELTPGQDRKTLTGFTTFEVRSTFLPAFVEREIKAGDKLVSPYGFELLVQSYRKLITKSILEVGICECRYLSPFVYAYVPREILTGSAVWYLDKLPDESDLLSTLENLLSPLQTHIHVTPNGHILQGRREIVSNKAECTCLADAKHLEDCKRIFNEPFIGAPGESVVEKAERLFKEAENVYADMEVRHFKMPDLNQRPKKITAEDKLKHYEPVLAFDSVDRLFEYNKLFNAQAAERQRDFEIACETKKAEIVKWMESRITKLDTKREETSDTIRKMTIGSKIKGYKECLSYIRTRL